MKAARTGHSDTLATLDTLGNLLKNQKRYAESEMIYRAAFDGRRRALGIGHPDAASTAYNLACAFALDGKRDQAFANLKLAIEHGLSADTRRNLEKDEDLNSLQGDPRFDALVAAAQKSK